MGAIMKGSESKISTKFLVTLSLLRQLRVEPAVLLVYTTALVNYIFSQNIILQQACIVNLNYTSDICDAIRDRTDNVGNLTNEENQIQVIAADVRTYRSLIDNLVPIFAVLFFGPWSDRHGRKFPMLMATFGFAMQSVCLIVFSLLENTNAYTVGLSASTVSSLFGTLRLFSMAATSYSSDISTPETRTLRIGLLQACISAGVPTGFAIGGALYSSPLETHYGLAIACGFATLAFIIILVFVKDVKTPLAVEFEKQATSINPIKSVREVAKVAVKKREGNKRMGLIFLLISIGCIAGPETGEVGVMFLFLMKRLSWDAGKYSNWSTYQSVVNTLGSLLSVGVLSHYLKLSDPIVGFIAGISQVTSCVIYALAYTTFMIFLAPAVDLMNGTMAICATSMVTKLVDRDEIGKLFSLIGIIQLLTVLAIDPLYSTLYKHTLDIFEGSFWILSALLMIPPLLTFVWFIYLKFTKKDEKWENLESGPRIIIESTVDHS